MSQAAQPSNVTREAFPVDHMSFEIITHECGTRCYAMHCEHEIDAAPLFTGFISTEMAAELRALADGIDAMAENATTAISGKPQKEPEHE